MSDLNFDVSVKNLPSFRVDAMRGDSAFQVIIDARDLRRLRSSLVEMGRIARQGRHSILILDEPQISNDRLFVEWQGIQTLFQPDILESMTLYIRRQGDMNEILGCPLTDRDDDAIEEVVKHARERSIRPSRGSSEASFDILRVMLVHWLRKTGPMTSKDLSLETGFSYPTIARTLEELEPHLRRHSDRRVELQSFPKEAWLKLVAQIEKVRGSRGYTDRSGRPRAPEMLLDRLKENNLRNLCNNAVAVGGTFGARHYLPSIDLIGNPRLDLVMDAHSGQGHRPIAIDTLIHKLDPALKPAKRGEPFQVVVHTLYRQKSFFTEANDGTLYADEVECLLDLHEARLEQQALEFLEKLTPRKNS
ncbi:MAG: hypothetical protein ACK40T_05600 [Akkermansiaceae bacterium]